MLYGAAAEAEISNQWDECITDWPVSKAAGSVRIEELHTVEWMQLLLLPAPFVVIMKEVQL